MKRSSLLAALTATVIPFSAIYADALLFPYVVTSDTVATIISVVNKDTSDELFLNYFTKNSLANTASCTNQLRDDVDSADNDLVSFEVNDSFIGGVASALGGPLFNDPAGDADYGGDNFTLGPVSGPTRAFLIVDDNDNDGEDLYGEAMLLETLGGAAWGYRAYNAATDFGRTGLDYPEFDAIPDAGGIGSPTNDNLGEVLDTQNNTDAAAVTLLPTDEWETRFFVTPINGGDQRLCENCNAAIKLTRNTSESALGIYDRDSNPLTGSNTIEVVCVSGVSLEELLPTNLQATVAAQGGWGYVNVDAGSAGGTTAPGAVVLKLEFNSAQFISPDTSNSFVGTVNTAVWLRNRDNTEGVSGF